MLRLRGAFYTQGFHYKAPGELIRFRGREKIARSIPRHTEWPSHASLYNLPPDLS